MNFIHTYRVEILIFGLSLIFHAVLLVLTVNTQGTVLDVVRVDDGYYELAQNILAGNGFSWSTEAPYIPNSMRTPGYIYVLAFLISVMGVTGAAIIQLVAASLIPVLGMYITQSITNSKKTGILTGIILTIDPTLAFLSFQFYTDTLFLLLFLFWLILTFNYAQNQNMKTLILSALLLGLAILVRPVVQYLPILIVICIIWQFGKSRLQQAIIHAVIYLLTIGIVLTPWIVRNINTFDRIGLSAQSTFVLYTNLAPAVLSVANKTDFLAERDAFLTTTEYKGDAITLTNAGEYKKKALGVIKENPQATAYVVSKSLFTFFTNDGFYTFLKRIGQAPANFFIFLVTMRIIWIFITLLALVGAFRYIINQRTPWALFTVTLIAYFALTSTIAAFGTNPRYRLPVDPIIIALASIGFTYILSWIQQRLRVK